MGYKYISSRGLDNLKNYQYHGIDNSWLANNIMQPYWRWLSNYLPMWLAPNLVTLLGFFAIVASYLLTAYYSPTIREAAPSWVFYFSAVCIFWYQTMDALDGKQARRTGTSSPLGELFDHGCDAISTTLIGLTFACSMLLGSGWFFFYVTLSSYCVFFMAQWEEFQTGVMELGAINVTEIQLMICLLYSVSGYLGPTFWTQTINIFGIQTTYNMIPGVLILIGAIATMLNNVKTVISYQTKNKKSVAAAMQQLVPIVVLVVGASLWAYLSPTDVSRVHPHQFFLIIGFMFSYITGRIVTHRVCQEHFGVFYPIELGLFVAIAYCLLNGQQYFPEIYLVYVYLVLSIGQYLHFALVVIQQMCDRLAIKCLRIAPNKKAQ